MHPTWCMAWCRAYPPPSRGRGRLLRRLKWIIFIFLDAPFIPRRRILIRRPGTVPSFLDLNKRTNRLIQEDGEKRDKINNFIEKNYQGDLKILHYLEILKQEIGFSQLKERVKKPLTGLKAAAYYGCMLLRPFEEMRFDDKERPTIFEEFLGALGAEAIDFPFKIECCGSFQSVGSPDVATECAYKILCSAIKRGGA